MTLFEPVSTKVPLLWQAVYFCGWIAITGIGLTLHPDPAGHGTHQQLGLPPCPSALLFNRPCPGCGLTTSWTALLHGQWAMAWSAHPLGPILYAGFTASAAMALYGFVAQRRLLINSVGASRFLGTCAIAFFLFGAVRMALTPNFRTASETTILAKTFSADR